MIPDSFFQKMARRALRSMLDISGRSSRRKLHERVSCDGSRILLVVPGPHFCFEGLDFTGDQGTPIANLDDAEYDEYPKANRETY
jgi:hypothetical protein